MNLEYLQLTNQITAFDYLYYKSFDLARSQVSWPWEWFCTGSSLYIQDLLYYIQSDVMLIPPLTFNASIATLLAIGFPPYVDPCCKERGRMHTVECRLCIIGPCTCECKWQANIQVPYVDREIFTVKIFSSARGATKIKRA